MCFLFVFSAILEYAFVSYLVFKNREEEREKEAMRKKHDDVSGRQKKNNKEKKNNNKKAQNHVNESWNIRRCNIDRRSMTAVNNVLTNGTTNQKAPELAYAVTRIRNV